MIYHVLLRAHAHACPPPPQVHEVVMSMLPTEFVTGTHVHARTRTQTQAGTQTQADMQARKQAQAQTQARALMPEQPS